VKRKRKRQCGESEFGVDGDEGTVLDGLEEALGKDSLDDVHEGLNEDAVALVVATQDLSPGTGAVADEDREGVKEDQAEGVVVVDRIEKRENG
jgi:hypothetical protein